MARVVEADYGVPHCAFKRNDDGGFSVSFKKLPVGFAIVLFLVCLFSFVGAGIFALSTGSGWVGFLFMMVLIIGGTIVGANILTRTTTIVVDPDYVTINGKSMARSDFGNFHVASETQMKIQNQNLKFVKLGYSFGNRSYPLGGGWDKEGQAQEVAVSLNSHLRRAPIRGDEHTINPNDLRQLRPTDF